MWKVWTYPILDCRKVDTFLQLCVKVSQRIASTSCSFISFSRKSCFKRYMFLMILFGNKKSNSLLTANLFHKSEIFGQIRRKSKVYTKCHFICITSWKQIYLPEVLFENSFKYNLSIIISFFVCCIFTQQDIKEFSVLNFFLEVLLLSGIAFPVRYRFLTF